MNLVTIPYSRLDPGNAPQVRETLKQSAQAGEPEESRSAWYHLWRATGERADLAEAHRLLESSLAAARPEYREAMALGHRINRDIRNAWEKA